MMTSIIASCAVSVGPLLPLLLLVPFTNASDSGLRGQHDGEGTALDRTYLDPFTAGEAWASRRFLEEEEFVGEGEYSYTNGFLPLPEDLLSLGLNYDGGGGRGDGDAGDSKEGSATLFDRDDATSTSAVRMHLRTGDGPPNAAAANEEEDDSAPSSGGGDASAAMSKRIVGGRTATAEQRHFCMILDKGDDGGWYQGKCGATLIGDRHVLTAAHCCHNSRKNDIAKHMDGCYMNAFAPTEKVTRNSKELWNRGYEYQAIPFKSQGCGSCEAHPLHKPGAATSYDVMICELEYDAHSSLTRMPVAGPGYFDSLASGKTLEVSGFGRTNNSGGKTSRLKVADVSKVGRPQCSAAMAPWPISDTMICAGGDGRNDSCNGDSGGPLTNDGEVLLGPVSWGSAQCATKDKPGIYTDLGNQKVHDWIKGMNIPGITFKYGSSGGGNNGSNNNGSNNSNPNKSTNNGSSGTTKSPNTSCRWPDASYTFPVWNKRRERQENNMTCDQVRSNGWCDNHTRKNGRGVQVGRLCRRSCPSYC